jgi:Sec-independent protein secretion pathway component TatC
MTTVISVSFAAAIAFQLPLLIRLLASIGLVTADGMRQYRKVAVVALLVFAAVITPPDVVSQCLIFVPCYILYEYGIGIAERIEKRRAKEEAEYQAKMEAEKAAQAANQQTNDTTADELESREVTFAVAEDEEQNEDKEA